MSRGGAKQKSNRRTRRDELREKAGCCIKGCGRRAAFKIDLEGGASVGICHEHYDPALAKGIFRTNENTEFV